MASVTKIWVKAKKGCSFTDIGQEIIIHGAIPFEVEETARIKQGLSSRIIEKISTELAEKMQAEIDAKELEDANKIQARIEQKAAFEAAKTDADEDGLPDGDTEDTAEAKARLGGYSVKELLNLVNVLNPSQVPVLKQEKKPTIVNWLIGNGGTAVEVGYCGVPTSADHVYLLSVNDNGALTSIFNAYIGVLSQTEGREQDVTDLNTLYSAWYGNNMVIDSVERCALVLKMIQTGWTD